MGHDLIKYYATYLAGYEDAHPKDVIPFGVNGVPHGASAAARAAAAPLCVGDRIQVWAPAEKVWRTVTVAALGEGEGVVTVSYEDGDSETLHMAKVRACSCACACAGLHGARGCALRLDAHKALR